MGLQKSDTPERLNSKPDLYCHHSSPSSAAPFGFLQGVRQQVEWTLSLKILQGCLCSLLIMATWALLHHLTLASPPALLCASCPRGSPCCSQSDLLCDRPKSTTPCQLSPMLTHFSLTCCFLCLSLSPPSQAPGSNSCDFSLFSFYQDSHPLGEAFCNQST